MIIHLQNCSLTIAHIGTREEIEVQILAEKAIDGVVELGRQVGQWLDEVAEAARCAGRQLAAFMETDGGKELAKACNIVPYPGEIAAMAKGGLIRKVD